MLRSFGSRGDGPPPLPPLPLKLHSKPAIAASPASPTSPASLHSAPPPITPLPSVLQTQAGDVFENKAEMVESQNLFGMLRFDGTVVYMIFWGLAQAQGF